MGGELAASVGSVDSSCPFWTREVLPGTLHLYFQEALSALPRSQLLLGAFCGRARVRGGENCRQQAKAFRGVILLVFLEGVFLFLNVAMRLSVLGPTKLTSTRFVSANLYFSCQAVT